MKPEPGTTVETDPMPNERAHRGTIHVEEAEVLANACHPSAQHVLRLEAPDIARRARAGSFVHVRCDSAIPMRRPMSIMRVDPEQGWLEVLFKVVGAGTRALALQAPGARLSLMGPIGVPFTPVPGRDLALLIGGGVGIPPMLFLADELRRQTAVRTALVLMGSEVAFPFVLGRSSASIPGIGSHVDACLSLLEGWAVPSRLASTQAFSGCFEGYVTEAARDFLEACSGAERRRMALYACGPTPMLAATARLAAAYDIPARVSLEEFMACAVGGCAGCAVRISVRGEPAMKRVCVDGPVFDAACVDWASLPH